ncbi:hypothetical protein LINGRAHAP2_LOCUS1707, partial [Linum grandiflorum]
SERVSLVGLHRALSTVDLYQAVELRINFDSPPKHRLRRFVSTSGPARARNGQHLGRLRGCWQRKPSPSL